MRRRGLPLIAVGLACAVLLLIGGAFGSSVLPSCLGAWLVFAALPLGALPIVLAVDLAETSVAAPIEPTLRTLAGLMPLAAVLFIPILFGAKTLFPGVGEAQTGFPGVWFGTGFFILRAILVLVVWSVLGLVAARRPHDAARPRRRLVAGVGLGLHLAMGTTMAADWVLAVEPGFASSGFGLMFMSAQVGLALAVAALMRPSERERRDWRALSIAMAACLGFWLFLQFTHYLVIWSANLPAEVAWYHHRSAGIGQSAQYVAAVGAVAAVIVLVSRRLSHSPALLAATASALILLHAVEMFWFVTPGARGHFSFGLYDIVAVIGVAAATAGVLRLGLPTSLPRGLRNV